MDQLADEYRGRAVVAAFRAYTFYFGVPCDEIKSRYEVVLVPTVILFVNGQEKHRWFADYSADSYRKVLDEVLGPPAPKKPPAAGESPSGKS
jgi:thioredoxin-like negative regulator of GroEL